LIIGVKSFNVDLASKTVIVETDTLSQESVFEAISKCKKATKYVGEV